jgi:hypothetical protein
MAEAPAKTEPETAGLPASPLAGADPAKHEHAAPANGKDGDAKPAESKAAPEAKPEPKAEAKAPEPEKSPAESGEKPPETKPEAKEPPKPEAKPEPEKKPEAEVKEKAEPETKPEVKPEAPKEPVVAPSYDKLTIPEGVKLDDARVAKFDEIVGKAELSGKADHTAMASLRQDLVNFHIEEMGNVAKAVQKNQVDVWNRLVEQRVNELKSDPDLGGNRIETSLGNAKYALESLIPGFTKAEATELIGIMDKGGVSHHRLTIKMLNAVYNLLAEPEPVNNGQPLNARQAKQAGDRGWYDKVDTKQPASA